MERDDKNELMPIDLVKELQDEASSEIFESIAEGLMPKLKIMIPKAIKTIDEDDSLLIPNDELIIIGRSEEDGSVMVMRGKKSEIDITASEGAMDVKDLTELFAMLLDMMNKSKKG